VLIGMIDRHGVQFDPLGDGVMVKAVDMEKVRAEFNSRWHADGDTERKRADAKRKRFNSGRDQLQDQGRINFRQANTNGVSYVWLVEPKDKPGMDRMFLVPLLDFG